MRLTQEQGWGGWQTKQAGGPCITPGHKQAKFYQLAELKGQVHNWGGERVNCFRKNWVEFQLIEASIGASTPLGPSTLGIPSTPSTWLSEPHNSLRAPVNF